MIRLTKNEFYFQAIKYLERMLIQAYCQQEREKRCTITAKAAESNSQDAEESSVEKMDTDETTDQTVDGRKTPKVEPNESPTPNDVEMIDTTEPVTAIKQEPEDEVTSIETDPLAEGDEEGGGGGGSKANCGDGSDSGTVEGSENATKSDSQQSENPAIKMEADENCNDSSSENNKENPSESTTATTPTTNTDEPIKIEESTADKDDPYSKDINIDPRTYCKLGHFHLLLEDYAKGMNESNQMNSIYILKVQTIDKFNLESGTQ